MGVTRIRDEKKEKEKEARKAEKKKKKKIEKPKKVIPKELRAIVRIAEADLDGTKSISTALLKVKGIGQTLARAIPQAAGIKPNTILGSLDDGQMKKLKEVISDPMKFGIPSHLLNRQAEPVSGEDKHLVASELIFAKKFDIDMMKKIRSYRGIRHEIGLPVRGQRTRSSFRTGVKVGVVRKKALERAKAKKKK